MEKEMISVSTRSVVVDKAKFWDDMCRLAKPGSPDYNIINSGLVDWLLEEDSAPDYHISRVTGDIYGESAEEFGTNFSSSVEDYAPGYIRVSATVVETDIVKLCADGDIQYIETVRYDVPDFSQTSIADLFGMPEDLRREIRNNGFKSFEELAEYCDYRLSSTCLDMDDHAMELLDLRDAAWEYAKITATENQP